MHSGRFLARRLLERGTAPKQHRRMPKRDPSGLAPDRSTTALIILDLISDYSFEDGDKIARAALPVARRIARLKARAKNAGVPAIYVNDGLGRWRSDFPGLVRHCSSDASRGAPIVKEIAPAEGDYCVLKPKHSGFYATALETLLDYIGAKRLILTGVSSHQCVLFTANDAYVRDLSLAIPRDCISARYAKDTRLALEYFTRVLGADVRPSSAVRFGGSKQKQSA
jgi:nicotinamidase-related amidase